MQSRCLLASGRLWIDIASFLTAAKPQALLVPHLERNVVVHDLTTLWPSRLPSPRSQGLRVLQLGRSVRQKCRRFEDTPQDTLNTYARQQSSCCCTQTLSPLSPRGATVPACPCADTNNMALYSLFKITALCALFQAAAAAVRRQPPPARRLAAVHLASIALSITAPAQTFAPPD